jgi:hypothetical protein
LPHEHALLAHVSTPTYSIVGAFRVFANTHAVGPDITLGTGAVDQSATGCRYHARRHARTVGWPPGAWPNT